MAEELKQRKLDMIAAIQSNPNYDSKEVDKQAEISKIEDAFDEAIEEVYRGRPEPQIDKKNPFFAAIDRGLDWIDDPNAQKRLDAAGERGQAAAEVPHSSEAEIDQ